MRIEIQTLRTAQKDWDFLIGHLKTKLNEFVSTVFPKLPENLYKVEASGHLNEGFDITPYYIYPFNTWPENSKKVTKKDVERLTADIEGFTGYNIDKLSFEYKYIW